MNHIYLIKFFGSCYLHPFKYYVPNGKRYIRLKSYYNYSNFSTNPFNGTFNNVFKLIINMFSNCSTKLYPHTLGATTYTLSSTNFQITSYKSFHIPNVIFDIIYVKSIYYREENDEISQV